MAVYAPIDRENFPHETELRVTEMQGLERKLRQYNANYQVGMERRVLWGLDEAEYRYIVLKWKPTSVGSIKTREVLLETTDPDQVIATLKMLLSIEREPK